MMRIARILTVWLCCSLSSLATNAEVVVAVGPTSIPRGDENVLLTWDSSKGRFTDESEAHFGLGEYDHVNRLEIEWSTGGTTVIPGKLEAGQIYSLQRSALDPQ